MAVIYGVYSGRRNKQNNNISSTFERKKDEKFEQKKVNQVLRDFRKENPNAFCDGPIYTRFPYRKIK